MQKKPYGLWSSPLSPKTMAGQLSLSGAIFAEDALVWAEGRSAQSVVVVQRGVDAPRDATTEHSARGGVGYGGGALGALGDTVYFACGDGRVYSVGVDGGTPKPLTPAFGRVASPTPSPDGDFVAFVHTDHHIDSIGIIPAKGGWPTQLVSGADFYMQPAWHPASTHLAWISWDQPQMPWDGARLEVARVSRSPAGAFVEGVEVIAGGEAVAVQQPSFSPDGEKLAYISDETGWSHIYVRDLATGETSQLTHGDCDHSTPGWVQGLRHFAWAPDSSGIYGLRHAAGFSQLWFYRLDGESKQVEGLDEYTTLSQISVGADGRVALVAAASQLPTRLIVLDPASGGVRIVKRASAEQISTEALSKMEPVSWRAEDGTEIFGNYYPPTNPGFTASGKPPAIIMIHGGPTAQRVAGWESRNQFFATRGYAVLDVNYRGSTGYGRAYMDALRGNWGVFDVEDAVGGAKFLGDEGLADPSKIVIMGGSAGGYTVLHSLVKRPGVFAAGISMYGISNLFTLAATTHKFEAAYNDSLLGALPEAADVYKDRSPIFSVDQLTDPLAVFQGADDKVVPPDQAEAIVASLRGRGVPHVYHLYEGEGHGWRKSETVEHFYNAVLEFLSVHVIYS